MRPSYPHIFLLLLLLLTACEEKELTPSADADAALDTPIRVGITTAGTLLTDDTSGTTRAANDATQDEVDAETQEWLVGPLKGGLDITYGKVGEEKITQKVAILRLTDTADDAKGIKLTGTGANQYAIDEVSNWAVYTFKYRTSSGEGADAIWHGNGAHYFEGVYVPDAIRYGEGVKDPTTGLVDADRVGIDAVNTHSAPNLLTDQSNDANSGDLIGNYVLLARYLGMPAGTRLSATVARIKLPFRHRLCRVIAMVLIDPDMGPTAKLEGYDLVDGKDDPRTTKFTFCNVKVLRGVKDEVGSLGHHTLTPQWVEQRKVTPHFIKEYGSTNRKGVELDSDFLCYFHLKQETYLYPTDEEWASVKTNYQTAYNAASGSEEQRAATAESKTGYRQINYGKVPGYDIIARPTYTSVSNVMYDEEGVKKEDGTEDENKKKQLANQTNRIVFELTLNNGLEYSKEFNFDLDANYETVVYLRISREAIDYNNSGSELWVRTQKYDDWYGVDNELGHSLSDAGSSWQRAYMWGAQAGWDTGDTDDRVTDGGFYNETTDGEDGTKGQYLTEATWKEYFAQAYEGGKHHGDYFALKQDITIDAAQLPSHFVFTGHLDAQDHTITLTGANKWATCTFEPLSTLKQRTEAPAPSESEAPVDGASSSISYEPIPPLYTLDETAQAPSRPAATAPSTRAGSIPSATPVALDMTTTLPTDLTALDAQGITIAYYDEASQRYLPYVNRAFWRLSAPALFYGLNGIYDTRQEREAAAGRAYRNVKWEWEANVHEEIYGGTKYWVPYRDITSVTPTGWRAEVLNLKLQGTLFTGDAAISGNVQNCYDGNGTFKVEDHVPAYPKY